MRKLFAVGTVSALGLWAAWPLASWPAINAQIHADYPQVQSITTRELAEQLARLATEGKPLLLDVRTEPEFAVSHLPGSERIEPGAEGLVEVIDKQRPIVTYSSVGYRSAAFAERLREAGFTQVRNLEGSIFQWANEGRPLVAGETPVTRVHPYNRVWSGLLNKPQRASVPPAS